MLYAVAPFVGAWIEIVISLRSRYRAAVAPFVGAWIEILTTLAEHTVKRGRSVRRSVD